MTSLMTLPTKHSHDHRDYAASQSPSTWSCLARPCRCKPTAWSSTPSSGAGGGRCGGRGARVLAYQPYTFTSGDEVKFQRGPDYFSVWVNGSVMMTVPVDWEADR